MSKIIIKLPLLIGISWFLFAFLASEISFRTAKFLYDFTGMPVDGLYQISNTIDWPANAFYDFRYFQILKSSIEQYNQDSSSLGTIEIERELENISEEELLEIAWMLESMGFKTYLSTFEEYVVNLLACALSGVILAVISGLIINLFFNKPAQGGLQMNMQDTGKVKNHVKVKSLLIAIIVHLVLAMMTLGISLVLLLITGLTTNALLKKEVNEAASGSNKFKKNFPFKRYGEVVGSFQHVFSHEKILDCNLFKSIESELTSKTPIGALSTVAITDIDGDLEAPEERTFIKSQSGQTKRGTSITLILYQSSFGKMQSIQWRVLAGGYIDRNKKFNLIAYSVFSLLLWIIPYLKKEFDLLGCVRTIYPGAYNDMDLVTQARCIHEAVFDAMINELDANDIDTSDLKAQKMQIMNINISGGKVSMGNVVQGAMNKVSNQARGSKA